MWRGKDVTVAGDSGPTPTGTVAPAALPEPDPIVLLLVAIGICLGRNWRRGAIWPGTGDSTMATWPS